MSKWYYGSFGHGSIPVRGKRGDRWAGMPEATFICFVSGPHGQYAVLDIGDDKAPLVLNAKYLEIKFHGAKRWESLSARIV